MQVRVIVKEVEIECEDHDLGYFAEATANGTVLHRTKTWAGEAVNCTRIAEDWATRNGHQIDR